MKDIITKQKCPFRAKYRVLTSKKGKAFYNAVILKSIFQYGLDFEKADIERALQLNGYKDYFNYREKETDNKTFVNELLRLKQYLLKINAKVVRLGSTEKLNLLPGKEIEISYDIAFEIEGSIYICNIKRKKPELSYAGRTDLTKSKRSLELYGLYNAGTKLYPNKHVSGCIFYLKNDLDKDGVFSEFEYKKGKNVIFESFEVMSQEDNETLQILNNTINNLSDEKCGKDCEICEVSNICTFVNGKKASVINNINPQGTLYGCKKAVTFNEKQRELINVKEGIYRINAVAGSGKTASTTQRVVELIKNGCNPEEILLTTFTNKGVSELREKLTERIKESNINIDFAKFNIKTFNQLGGDLLNSEYQKFGFTEKPKIIDSITNYEIISDIMDSYPELSKFNYLYPYLNFIHAQGAVVKMSSILQRFKKEGCMEVNEIMKEYELPKDEANILIEIFIEYRDTLIDNNYIDFNDQISYCLKVLEDENNLNKLGYKHIIVDEFQDSSNSEFAIVIALSKYKYCKSLMILGDDSQAIYSFKGANQWNIIQFHDYFNDVKDITLDTNYRSTTEITTIANKLNDLNVNKIDKKIIAIKNGEAVELMIGDKIDIVKQVSELLKAGKTYSDIAIITRTKKELLDLNKELSKLNIPSILAQSELLIDNEYVKNIIGFSHFLIDDSLTFNFAQYVQIIKSNELETTKDLKEFIKEEKEKFLTDYAIIQTEEAKINFFYDLFEKLSGEEMAVKILLDICKEKEFKKMENLITFMQHIIDFKSDLFVEKSSDVFDAITLTTAHSSKGREFDSVILRLDSFKYPKIKSSNPKIPPKILTAEEILNLEEERRLVFTGITRAKNNLILTDEKEEGFFEEIKNLMA